MYYFFFLSRHLLCSLTFLVLQWFFCRWDYIRIIPVIYIAIYLCGHRDFLFHTKIPFWGWDFNFGWFFSFVFSFGWDSFIWMIFLHLDEILLSERDFSFGWDSLIWMRFFIWMISFIWGAIDPRAFLFHTKIPFGVRFVGGGFWETDAPSFIRSHHGSSPFYSVFLYQPPR